MRRRFRHLDGFGKSLFRRRIISRLRISVGQRSDHQWILRSQPRRLLVGLNRVLGSRVIEIKIAQRFPGWSVIRRKLNHPLHFALRQEKVVAGAKGDHGIDFMRARSVGMFAHETLELQRSIEGLPDLNQSLRVRDFGISGIGLTLVSDSKLAFRRRPLLVLRQPHTFPQMIGGACTILRRRTSSLCLSFSYR